MIRHQFTPVFTIYTDDDGTNPRYSAMVMRDSYSESWREDGEAIEDLTGSDLEAAAVAFADQHIEQVEASVAMVFATGKQTPPDAELAEWIRRTTSALIESDHPLADATASDQVDVDVIRWAFLAVPDGEARCRAWDGRFLDDEEHKTCGTCRSLRTTEGTSK